MTGNELLQYQLEQVGKQLDACLSGMSETAFTTKCAPNGMAPGEILEHLCEAYQAYVAHTRGEKHSWGTFSLHDKCADNVKKVFGEMRAAAVAAALAGDDEDRQKAAYDYIIGHDNYHVGQLVLARLQVELDWDSDAIYS